MNIFGKLFQRMPGFVMPNRCPFCHKAIDKKQFCCKRCAKDIPRFGIFQGVKGGYKCSSAFLYKDKFKRAVINFKFHNKPQYSKQFAHYLYESIQRNYPDMVFDCITYVPMHHKAYNKRGYNQSQLLANDLSELMGIPCVSTITKIKMTKPQHKLSGKQRLTNLKGAFKVVDKSVIKGKSILLIDDIITTGSTLHECTKTLQKGKPAYICCATLLTSGNLY